MLKDVLIDHLQIIILCSIVISAIFDLIMRTNWIDALFIKAGKDDSELKTAKLLIGFGSALIVSYISGLLGRFLDATGFIILSSCVFFFSNTCGNFHQEKFGANDYYYFSNNGIISHVYYKQASNNS